jgi:GT2 family glycosyltransferase
MCVDIVIISYNYKQFIVPLLNSLEECQKVSNVVQKIIVVDNNSTDGSKEVLKEWFGQRPSGGYSLNLLNENKGYAYAVNYGARCGNYKYIMILNADMLVLDINWKEKFLKTFQLNPKTAVVGCKLIDQFNKVVGAGTGGTIERRQFRAYGVEDNSHPSEIFNQMAHCVNVCGAAYMTKRHIFNQMGGFDEAFFMYYEEEYFSIKVQKLLGMLVVYTPFTKFLHYSNPLKVNNENKYQRISGGIFVKKCREELGIQGVNP